MVSYIWIFLKTTDPTSLSHRSPIISLLTVPRSVDWSCMVSLLNRFDSSWFFFSYGDSIKIDYLFHHYLPIPLSWTIEFTLQLQSLIYWLEFGMKLISSPLRSFILRRFSTRRLLSLMEPRTLSIWEFLLSFLLFHLQ